VPVVLTDSPSFRSLRTPGVVLEYLRTPPHGSGHRPEMSWDDLLTERLTRLFSDHGCVRTRDRGSRTTLRRWPTC
jgi:hypothetical protein